MAFKILYDNSMDNNQAKKSSARVGILETEHYKLETPFFMPVATRAGGKYIGSDDYNDIGIKVIITNALINYLKPGLDVFGKKEPYGMHNFMNFHNAIFTDCGGFQMSRSFYIKSSKKGLHFRSPFNNQKHIITPEKNMRIQRIIGSDVAMMQDNMPPVYANRDDVVESLKKTHKWAEESLREHLALRDKKTTVVDNERYILSTKNQLIFGISQGALYNDLRKESSQFISELKVNGIGFDGVAIGGLAIGEKQDEMLTALESSLSMIPKDKPRYLMGVGNPVDILEAVSRGVDIFDSVYPTRNGRHGSLFTWEGVLDIGSGKYSKDNKPVEENCQCHTCRNFSRRYLHHLYKINEPAYKRYAQIHNLYFMNEFMNRIREEIKKGTFEEFKKGFWK